LTFTRISANYISAAANDSDPRGPANSQLTGS